MRHPGLTLRMAVVGSVLFGFYALLALFAYATFGAGVLPIVAVGSVLFVGVQYVVGKKTALWSVGAEDLPADRYPEVHDAVADIADEMGIEKPRLMIADMGVPNAFAVGRRGAGVVVVSSELLSTLDRAELRGVLAHELAHVRNRDVVLMVLGQSIASLVGLAVQFAVILTGDDGLADLLVGYLAGAVAQVLVMVFVLAISRYREYAADADAADVLGDGDPLASALEAISDRNQRRDVDVDTGVNALCIFGADRGLLERVFATHPPVEKRIERLRAARY
ncbi:MAG: M48 family metalloprotease [Haloarculaceae archaeon]